MRQYYLSVIMGRRRGLGAMLLRILLAAATVVYYSLHKTRQLLYGIGLLPSVRLGVPVISVGNLTAGGTGKTPFVEMLARRLAKRAMRVAILSRGYGRRADGGDDEEAFAEMELENVVRLTGRNRVALARRAIQDYRVDVIILDDGFQHYRIKRDLDILMIDATNPFAGGLLIPRGLLRERAPCAARADFIVLSRCDQVTSAELTVLREGLDRFGKPVAETSHRPICVRTLSNKKRQGLDWLRDRRMYAFCGIGNPEAFRRTLESLGTEIVKFRAFPDHHLYTPQDVRHLSVEAQEFMADGLITTEKDATKLSADAFGLPLAALRVEVEVTRGSDRLESCLRALLRETAPVTAVR
ncbi:MAG: tetraacyldisaccharide 4'-kinase [Planctomycetes bacterium]|nr:tetraacyldisaccharide 4'-kinase [Planctomycetota bacterium]